MIDLAELQRKMFAREVALQRKFGGKRPRRKILPRQVFPKPIAVEYAKALRALFRLAMEAYKPVLDAIARGTVRTDAPSDFSKEIKKAVGDVGKRERGADFPKKIKVAGREAQRLLDAAEERLNNAVSTYEVENLANKFAARTTNYQKSQLQRQMRSALGADPYMRDPVLAGVTEDFVAHNVSLIKRIPKRLHEKIEGLVMNSVAKSELNIDLAAEVQKQFGIAERHAMLIARDQISKYYGAVNKARQENLGVKKFIWRTVNDERVRDSHADLEGEVFSWDDLPTNDKGEEIYPGSEIQCRCSAEPVVDDLLDDLDEAETELEPPNFEEIDTDEEQDE